MMIDPPSILSADLSGLTGDLLKVLTGAGGSIVAMILWNKREQAISNQERDRADKATLRADKIADTAISVLTEVNLQLNIHRESIGGLDAKLTSEHEQTRDTVKDAITGIEALKAHCTGS